MVDTVHRFGNVEFNEALRKLTIAGRMIELDRPCAAILATLMLDRGKDVHKDRLLEAGWHGRLVHENSLAKAIGRLRHALGDAGVSLETVHGYGYRLATELEPTPAALPARPPRRPLFMRPLVAFAAALISGLAAWALVTPWQTIGQHRVVNGEPADSVGRVLWVDDHPDNNVKEREYLRAHKIGVYQVSNTEDALTLLQMYAYGAVVSDMGRGKRPLAGIDLLKAMRVRGDRRPFFLYTVHSSAAQRKLLADAGGQAVATDPRELYDAILPLFGEAEP